MTAGLQVGVRRFFDVPILALLWALDLLTSWHGHITPAWLDPIWVPVLSALTYLPLIWRRERPLQVLFLTVAASVLLSFIVPDLVATFGVWLSLYALAAHSSRGRAFSGFAASLIPIGLNALLEVRVAAPGREISTLIVSGLIGLTINIAVFGVGRWVRWSIFQRHRVAQLTAAEAVADERGRIARDLHDIVAHSVSLMLLQAAGAEKILQINPEMARAALHNVDSLGRQATVELQRMLGLLTSDDKPGGTPTRGIHGLADVDNLAENVRNAGIELEYSENGSCEPLDSGTDVAAYRIVQEALTNAVKYSDRSQPISLEITRQSSGVTIRVANRVAQDARRSARQISTGHGILGMKERVRTGGGTLSVGPTPSGDFLVVAQFPLPRSLDGGLAAKSDFGAREQEPKSVAENLRIRTRRRPVAD